MLNDYNVEFCIIKQLKLKLKFKKITNIICNYIRIIKIKKNLIITESNKILNNKYIIIKK